MDMTKENVERWYSMNEVCKHLAITRDTCLTWIDKRGMPGVKVGRTWRFKISEIDEWMRSCNARNSEGTPGAGTAFRKSRHDSDPSPADN